MSVRQSPHVRAGAADRVLEATEELRELRGRLAELDQERTAIEERIEVLLGDIAGKAKPSAPEEAPQPQPEPKPVPVNTCDKILETLTANPEQSFTATQLYTVWHDKGWSSLQAFYSALSRLTKQKKIRRLQFGRYSLRG